MIDLNRFATPVEVTMPLVRGEGIYKGRVVNVGLSDKTGVYQVLLGKNTRHLRQSDPIEIEEMMQKLPLFRGIAYGDGIIPLNFSVAKFAGYGNQIPVMYMGGQMGHVVKCRVWENSTVIYHEPDITFEKQMVVSSVKQHAEWKEVLTDVKEVTPEMRYFYMLYRLDLDRIEEWARLEQFAKDEAEKKRQIEEFRRTFAGRLQKSIEDAGGKLKSFNQRGEQVDVRWTIGGEEFSTVIKQDFSILELGFCADGHDANHSMASAILLAKQFIDEGLIYRTRII